MIHDSFSDWVEACVLRLRKSHPTWHRLDGWDAGGNREVVGRFRYQDHVWVVHGDTRFDPTLRAYEAIRNGHFPDQFVVERTRSRTKSRWCLNLRPELRNMQRPKHFYIYEQG